MEPDRSATVAEVYVHPFERDIIDKILLQTGRSVAWVCNPLVSRLQLRQLDKFLGHMFGPGFVDTLVDLLADCSESPPRLDGPIAATWWKRAVSYQIYLHSFANSNGDGIGDLPGILVKLPHLDDLGVDCLWFSPIFTSPNKDMGYDIADYRSVMAEMGTIDDLRRLIAVCHERRMHIISDLATNHTSNEHPWFRDVLADPEGAYGDYCFLRDGNPETPPDNWTSFFPGPAWRHIGEKQVLHLSAPEQPDLNWDNPAVRREVADIIWFWLAEGVDGFRPDVINYISKRDGLPNGNITVGQVMGFTGVEHYLHGPHLHGHLAELCHEAFTRTDVEPGREAPSADTRPIMIGKTPGAGIEVARLSTSSQRDELGLIFSFNHLETPGHVHWDEYVHDLSFLKRYCIDYQSRLDSDDWISLFFENYDNPYMISKANPSPRLQDQLGKALATILLAIRGTPFIFQGQETGAISQDFSDESVLHDMGFLNLLIAEGPRAWGKIIAGPRDHARVPMHWDRDEHRGFTRTTPWIKAFDDSVDYFVTAQEHNPNSVLRYYHRLIWLHRSNPMLSLGSIRFVDADVKDYFAWFREHNGECWFTEVNLLGHPLRRRHHERNLEIVVDAARDHSGPMESREVLICQVSRDGGK